MQELPLIIFQGPTGVGKSNIAEKLAIELGAEIISADSRQVYRFLDIATAKPSLQVREKVSYHLIDVVNPDQEYNAGKFAKDAQKKIEEIRSHSKIPFIVGGTGFYISALLKGLAKIPAIEEETKQYVKEFIEKHTPEQIYTLLQMKDPAAAHRIEKNDLHRQQRVLEVFFQTGNPISYYWQHNSQPLNESYLNILILREREELYRRINDRVDKMMEAGLLQEVKGLLSVGYKESDPGMNTVGYREFFPYLRNETDLDYAVEKVKQHTRNFAKRQHTWYNKQDFNLTFNPSQVNISFMRNKIEKFIKRVL